MAVGIVDEVGMAGDMLTLFKIPTIITTRTSAETSGYRGTGNVTQ